jgi:tellurite resistance protein TehA-like permease
MTLPEPTAELQPSASAQSQPGGDACAAVDGTFIMQWFSPRWFIFVMGTGAIANIYQLLAQSPTGVLHGIALLFLLLALVSFVAVSVLTVWRVLAHYACVAQEFTHSSLMQFYAAIPIAAAVVSTGLLNIPIAGVSEAVRVAIASAFWWVSLALSLLFIVLIPVRVILGDHAEPKRALGFWFLPPVGLFVFVFNGNFLAGHLDGAAPQAIFLLNTIVLGLALFLTVAVFTIFLFRAFFYSFPRPDVAPSYLIGLAPIGVAIIALNTYLPLYGKLAPAGLPPLELLAPLVGLLSLLLWGFGLWWLTVAVAIIAYKARTTGIPVTLGYWAFIFPPAAYTLSTLLLAGKYPLVFLEFAGQLLAVVVTLVWLMALAMVARNVRTKRIFLLPPSFADLDLGVGKKT